MERVSECLEHQLFKGTGGKAKEREEMSTETEPITGAFLNDLKVGDKVWVGNASYGKRSARILPVISRTKTLIRVPYPTGMPHSFRIVQWEHDHSWHAYESPARMFSDSILDIATPEECDEYERKQAKEAEALDRDYRARIAADAVMGELQKLLYPQELRNTNCIQITNAQWGKREENAGLFDVTFHGLTEQQVRELAEKIR